MRELDLRDVPRGNTEAGVYTVILEHLASERRLETGGRALDIPCGSGEFLAQLAILFPSVEIIGCDLSKPDPTGFTIIEADLDDAVSLQLDGTFDVVTCISGVMEFGNLGAFFDLVKRHLKTDGEFIVTNDNHLTVFDRLKYLIVGGTRRHPIFQSADEPTWKMVTLSALLRTLDNAGFCLERIEYVPVRGKDLLWLPIALALYPIQRLRLRPEAVRRKLFPFRSVLSRHYVLFCRPKLSDVS